MPSDCLRVLSIPSLVLIAHSVFLIDRGHRQVTDATDRPIPRIGYAGVE